VSVTYEVRDGIAWVTINMAVREGLFEAVHTLIDDAAEVLVLIGAGDRAFCAGGDLKEITAEELWAPGYLSADAQAGMHAFKEKPAPAWKGIR
jgi:enoyl-CoA hydratase/carnithine racemase